MADILPFTGIRYNAAKVGGDLSGVLAPPYDVISPAEQNALYETHPYNVIRLILGRETDRYQNANRYFHEWLDESVLTADSKPALYVYTQSFSDPVTGEPAPARIGLICLLKLEDYSSGKVLPHENTLTKAKADRLDLLRATHAQFESIYGLFSDPDNAVNNFLNKYDNRETVVARVDNMIGSSHMVEKIDDPEAIRILQELLKDKPIFIADGHHRYETSLNYRREFRANHKLPLSPSPGEGGGEVSADYILITLTAFEDEGLLVLPTHRQIDNLDNALIAALPASLSPQFTVTPIDPQDIETAIDDAAKSGRKALAVVLPSTAAEENSGVRAYLATLNATLDEIPALVPGELSDASKRLDVTILQRLILEERLGITMDVLAAGEVVTYTRDIREAIGSVANGRCQASFILGRPSVEDVRLVSLAGDKMPQKSTFFYPKLLSGLILRDLSHDGVS